ncbi:hypothetical protein ILS93_00670 [Bacillus sp. 16GRE42]|nr:hypothetical protein [Bacillus sp. 16GRE42]MBY7120642.1 hypothetical protein [Bacillus sp. 16GRE42]
MCKFLILYALLGVMEHVIKEKRQVGILIKSLFEKRSAPNGTRLGAES